MSAVDFGCAPFKCLVLTPINRLGCVSAEWSLWWWLMWVRSSCWIRYPSERRFRAEDMTLKIPAGRVETFCGLSSSVSIRTVLVCGNPDSQNINGPNWKEDLMTVWWRNYNSSTCIKTEKYIFSCFFAAKGPWKEQTDQTMLLWFFVTLWWKSPKE